MPAHRSEARSSKESRATAGGGDDDIVLRSYADEDAGPVATLLEGAFGSWPRELRGAPLEEFFEWKHAQCPFGPSQGQVAVAGGELVAFLALLPWPMHTEAGPIQTVRGVDLAVHPAHRGGGLGTRLIAYALRQMAAGVELTWSNPNAQGRRGARANGQGDIGRLRRYVRPCLSWRSFTRAGGLSEPDAPPAADRLDGARELLPGPAAGRLTTVKDVDYLRWRYGVVGDYRAIADDDGLAIFRTARRGPWSIIRVDELLVRGGDERVISRLLHRVQQACSAEFIVCDLPSTGAAGRLRFVPAAGGGIHVNPLRRGIRPDPLRRDSWGLSLGDLELL